MHARPCVCSCVCVCVCVCVLNALSPVKEQIKKNHLQHVIWQEILPTFRQCLRQFSCKKSVSSLRNKIIRKQILQPLFSIYDRVQQYFILKMCSSGSNATNYLLAFDSVWNFFFPDLYLLHWVLTELRSSTTDQFLYWYKQISQHP